MNPIADEILSNLGRSDDILVHYGVKRRSGRYPWGSGDTPYQHSGDFLSRAQELKKQGLSETEIAKAMNLDSTTQLRVAYKVAKNERRRLEYDRVKSLQADGLSPTEIGKIMGKNESSIRSILDEGAAKNMNAGENTAKMLKKELADKKMIDVGFGVEREMGVSKNTLEEAIFMLEAEGYHRYGVGLKTGEGKQTTVAVLCDPNITYSYAYNNPGEIQSFKNYHSSDGGKTFDRLQYPSSLDSNRVHIRYGDEGGADKDGVIELRRGVKDLDLGNSHYAQVRILTDGTHYLKGMAMYSDDIPDGVDVVFNTNKKSGTPKEKVFKKISDDPENPFGAYIKANGQSKYIDADGKEKLSPINKLKEEGDWEKQSKNLSSQFLSKQPMKLIKQQLNLTLADKKAEYDEICSLTNPEVKKKMLLEFADSCESSMVHIKAAALPRQETRVILPLTAMKENEVYAPYLKNGEKVALVRYPHGGTFEIPELTVNNKNKAARSILGTDVKDAIGINSKVAERLSGADFDGDTVVVIPLSDKVRVKTTPALKGLEGFDPKTQYSTEGKTGIKLMSESVKQKEMGTVSNLITDMTLQGAPEKDIVRAVRHSMVVIDAAKHKLDYKQSEKDNGIAELRMKYQPKYDKDGNVVGGGGASTLISKHKQTTDVPERQGSGRIDPDTGKVTYNTTGRTYVDKKGKVVTATTKVPTLVEVDDARTLSSGTPQENAYADYVNSLKALTNLARKEYKATGKIAYSSSAKAAYEDVVKVLDSKLRIAESNAPRERRAQAIANSKVKAKIQANPDLAKKENAKELNKVKKAAIDDARASIGASGKDTRIVLTDREWAAIQAGAVSSTKASKIFRYTDPDELRERALPKTRTTLSTAKLDKLRAMQRSGHTIAEIADSLGVSSSTVSKYINQ